MKKFFINVWNILNGNKTIIGSLLLGLLGVDTINQHIPPDILEYMQYGIGILTGASLVHHVKKGYFSPEKGH